jgi:hypothetical protein
MDADLFAVCVFESDIVQETSAARYGKSDCHSRLAEGLRAEVVDVANEWFK